MRVKELLLAIQAAAANNPDVMEHEVRLALSPSFPHQSSIERVMTSAQFQARCIQPIEKRDERVVWLVEDASSRDFRVLRPEFFEK
jgi:hypothetical protein